MTLCLYLTAFHEGLIWALVQGSKGQEFHPCVHNLLDFDLWLLVTWQRPDRSQGKAIIISEIVTINPGTVVYRPVAVLFDEESNMGKAIYGNHTCFLI